MAQLRQDFEKFAQLNTEIIVVGPEGSKQFEAYWSENDLPFVGLPNPDHSVLKQFGQEIKIFKFGRMPAQVIIDIQGVARYVHYGKSMADIPDNKELLEIIRALNEESQLNTKGTAMICDASGGISRASTQFMGNFQNKYTNIYRGK